MNLTILILILNLNLNPMNNRIFIIIIILIIKYTTIDITNMEHFLGSLKYEKNLNHHTPDFVCIDIKKAFLTKSNTIKLIKTLYNIHRGDGGKTKVDVFVNVIPTLMKNFAEENDIGNYRWVSHPNWYEELKAINVEFVEKYRDLFRWEFNQHQPDLNPFKLYYQTGNVNEYEDNVVSKRLDTYTAEDVKNADLWSEYNIYTQNNKFRNKNRPYAWQYSVQKQRRYGLDKDNDGLRYTKENSSLEVPIRGYDMSDIYDGTGKYQKKEWRYQQD